MINRPVPGEPLEKTIKGNQAFFQRYGGTDQTGGSQPTVNSNLGLVMEGCAESTAAIDPSLDYCIAI